MEIWPGNAYPLGATYDGTGVNFAVFSGVAERVELMDPDPLYLRRPDAEVPGPPKRVS